MKKDLDKSEEITLSKYEEIFRQYFGQLCNYALKYTRDLDSSKEIVHTVFINVWEKREQIRPEQNIRSYLYTSVYHRCLNKIRDSRKNVDMEHVDDTGSMDSNMDNMELIELEARIEAVIQSLPDKCREVFILSRYEELKYSAIADTLGISIKTVEAQMSKALKLLRKHLAEFLSIIIIIFLK